MSYFVCVETHTHYVQLSSHSAPARPHTSYEKAFPQINAKPDSKSVGIDSSSIERVEFRCTPSARP